MGTSNPWRKKVGMVKWLEKPGNRKRYREQIRKSMIKKSYGITLKQYDSIIAKPCGICGTTLYKRALDHDHKTRKIRGPLCRSCNSHLAWYENHLVMILNYLEGADYGHLQTID